MLKYKLHFIITKNKTEENLAQVDEIRNSKIAYDEIKQVKCGSCNYSCLLESELKNPIYFSQCADGAIKVVNAI